jgi:AcrR family transcriptional regulator
VYTELVPSETTSPSEPAPRPLRSDAQRNRERILAAAREVFAERGVEATLDDIAHHAGVGVGTVYRRFADKDELIDALFHERIEEIVALAEEAAAVDDAWAGLVRFFEHGLELHAEDRGLREVAFDGRRGGERTAHARARIAPILTGLLERARADGQVRADVDLSDLPLVQLMLFGLIDATHDLAPDLWRRYLALLLDGLRARPAGEQTPLPGPPLPLELVPQAMCRAKSRRGRPPT